MSWACQVCPPPVFGTGVCDGCTVLPTMHSTLLFYLTTFCCPSRDGPLSLSMWCSHSCAHLPPDPEWPLRVCHLLDHVIGFWMAVAQTHLESTWKFNTDTESDRVDRWKKMEVALFKTSFLALERSYMVGKNEVKLKREAEWWGHQMASTRII